MFDYSKLRGRIYEKYGHLKEFCNVLSISPVTLRAKMNNTSVFTNSEIIIMCEKLDIPKEKINEYFFTLKCS